MFHRYCLRRREMRALLPALVALTLLIAVPFSAAAQEGLAATPDVAPEPPVLTAPIDGADITATNYGPLAMPTLRWLPAAGATIYHIQISDSPGFSTILKETDTYGIDYTPTDVYQDGSYYWRVKAGAKNKTTEWSAYSEAFSFNKNWSNDEDNRPSPISPVGGVKRSAFPAEDFSWTPSPGAAGYKLEIATDPQFGNVVYSAETVKPHHTPLERFAANTYYWRVTPFAYISPPTPRVNGTASETATFQFAWNAPPQLIEPPATPIGGGPPELRFLPRFSWTAVEGAEEYQIQISTDENFATWVANYATRSTDFTPVQTLSNDQEYFWRVKAINFDGFSSAWSDERSFRAKWNVAPNLEAPGHLRTNVSYPFFSWEPVPGAERYQLQISSGDKIIADELVYNVNTYAYGGSWPKIAYGNPYSWRVRAVDARGNVTPWSATRSFGFASETSPEPIYPLYYHTPDAANMPVHEDNTVANPVFIWNTAHLAEGLATTLVEPDRYVLTVDDDPNFTSPNLSLETTGLAAAPTLEHPLSGVSDGMVLYWRIQAYREAQRIGADVIWRMRYDGSLEQIASTATLKPTFPRDRMEYVDAPPVLGWQPVHGADHYRVQVSRTPDFAQIIDEARPQFVYYVPWQGRLTTMPAGTYWWRARAENVTNSPVGDWSESRQFNLSTYVVWSNPFEFLPPTNILSQTTGYDPAVTFIGSSTISTGDSFDLTDLHLMVHENPPDFGWLIAFGVPDHIAGSLQYGIYVDADHVYGSGADIDPEGRPISADPYHRPEFVIYVTRINDSVSAETTKYQRWSDGTWQPVRTLDSMIGSGVWYATEPSSIHVLVPYGALDADNDNSIGSFAITVFSTDDTAVSGAHDVIPPQGQYYGNPVLFDNPAFVSNMVTPLYPFDTPLDNPFTRYQMPALHWRMPYYDTVDGYRVQIARDAQFSDVVETWEVLESNKYPEFGFLPASMQSKGAWEDNESYYWRVQIRHEQYDTLLNRSDGPWSPAMRFKLSSRLPGNPQLSTGAEVFMTPTFLWDRVEGASGYTLQIDNDANFSSPIINQALDGTSYTPQELSVGTALLPGTQYYWRLAMRRSSGVIGQWTPTMTFQKSSVSPTPINPSQGMTVTGQPTFQWGVVLTPTTTPRLATPRYHLQISQDPTFGTTPYIDVKTSANVYTPVKNKSLSDGIWYWRVALYDANNTDGPYSPTQWFAKQYLAPNLIFPSQGGTAGTVPTFMWDPLPGAAYYSVSYADNPAFTSATTVSTMSTSYTTVKNMTTGRYYWYVQMFDQDKKGGPIIPRYYDFGYSLFLPSAMK